ncbi:MAG: dihydroorotase [Clostridia bacterium]|nr:dihydroorotase [Clostridia bacterium]MDN5321861.1 dihydroorotase [Clostridia bacterium]
MLDIVIQNGIIVDGSGQKPYAASIGIKGNKIMAISENILQGTKNIDASGMVVSPGFIDMHTHSDTVYLLDNRSESKVFQGVTTEFVGNCGISLVPSNPENLHFLKEYAGAIFVGSKELDWSFNSLSEYVSQLKNTGLSINCAPFIGHGTLRIAVMGFRDSEPSPEELSKIKNLLERELKAGAWGMSLGLIYPPGSFSNTNELIELAKILVKYDAVLSAHIRGESDTVFNAVKEMISIAYKTGVHIHISHLKLMGTAQWGKADELLNLIETARKDGLRISCDQYPYEASYTALSALVPKWVHEGGVLTMLEKLTGSKKEEIASQIGEEMTKRGGPERVIVSNVYKTNPQWEGKNIAEISENSNLSPEETVIDVLLNTGGKARAIYYSMNQDDIFTIMQNLNIAVASDGIALDYDDKFGTGKPHPRNFGTFPRFLKLVRELKLLPLEKAVYKMTGLPASLMGLTDRGIIKEGNIADLVIFDPDSIEDTATFENPFQKPVGIKHVLVSGQLVIDNGKQTQERPGEVLLKINQ